MIPSGIPTPRFALMTGQDEPAGQDTNTEVGIRLCVLTNQSAIALLEVTKLGPNELFGGSVTLRATPLETWLTLSFDDEFSLESRVVEPPIRSPSSGGGIGPTLRPLIFRVIAGLLGPQRVPAAGLMTPD